MQTQGSLTGLPGPGTATAVTAAQSFNFTPGQVVLLQASGGDVNIRAGAASSTPVATDFRIVQDAAPVAFRVTRNRTVLDAIGAGATLTYAIAGD